MEFFDNVFSLFVAWVFILFLMFGGGAFYNIFSHVRGLGFYSEKRLEKLFAEWIRRYRESPDDFNVDFDCDDYAVNCVAYLKKLNRELK